MTSRSFVHKQVLLTVGLALLTVACDDRVGGAEIAESRTSQDRIVGGSAFAGLPGIGYLFASNPNWSSGLYCTATLVTSRKLLTAAHCVTNANGTIATSITYGFQDGTGGTSTAVAVHPQFLPDRILNYDVAIITLPQASALAPLPILAQDTQAAVGSQVLLVGYGTDNPNVGTSSRRSVTTSVNAIDTSFVHFGNSSANVCFGDSGGPVLSTVGGSYAIAAVISYVTAPVCYSDSAGPRLDNHWAFITAQTGLTAGSTTGTTGTTTGGSTGTTTGGSNCKCLYASYCGADSCGIVGTGSACQCGAGTVCGAAPQYQCLASTSTTGGSTTTSTTGGSVTTSTTGGSTTTSTTGGTNCRCSYAAYCGPDTCGVMGGASACKCSSGTVCGAAPQYQCLASPSTTGSTTGTTGSTTGTTTSTTGGSTTTGTTGGGSCTCPYAAYCGADSCGRTGTSSACQCATGKTCQGTPYFQCR